MCMVSGSHLARVQAGMITDPESNADQVMEFVGGLMARLEGLHKKAFTYKSYQKNFKVMISHSTAHCINTVHSKLLWHLIYQSPMNILLLFLPTTNTPLLLQCMTRA